MAGPENDADNDLSDELEAEVLGLRSLPETERRAALTELCARYPRHADLIEMLGGLTDLQVPPTDDTVVGVGEFRVLRALGEGGMGRVFLGQRDDRDARRVALKVIRSELGSADVLRRFQREAKMLRDLRHDAIARFYESGEGEVRYADGRAMRMPFLAMEYVDGRELLAHAAIHDLDPRQRVRLIVRVCEGLAYAHERGVVHRDVKPGNILVVADDDVGHPKLLDFGIARAQSSEGTLAATLTLTGQHGLLGTAPYMSPEQVLGGARDLDARSDVYSLGVVLFELLTGRLPYAIDAQALPEIARIITEQEPTQLGSLDTGLRGSPLEVIVATTLEKDPARRYANARELGADLTRFLATEPIRARPPSLWRRSARFARRNRVLVSTMLALALGLVFTTWFALREMRTSAAATELAYRASVSAAAAALADRDAATTRRLLDAAPEPLRGWEWRHLASRVDDSLATATLATGDSGTGTEARRTIAFAPDGSLRIGAYGSTAGVRVWTLHPSARATSSATLALETAGARSTRLAIVGSTAAVTGEKGLTLHDLSGEGETIHGSLFGEEVAQCSADPGGFLATTRAGRVFVVQPDGSVSTAVQLRGWPTVHGHLAGHAGKRWLVATAERRVLFARLGDDAEPVQLTVPGGQRTRVAAASTNGEWLALGGEDGLLAVWRVPEDGPPELAQRMFGHIDLVSCLAFDREGRRLASGGQDTTVRVWSLDRAVAERVHVGHAGRVDAVAFDASGERLASIGRFGEMRLWLAGPDPRVLSHPRTVTTMQLHDGVLYTGCADGAIRVFDAASSELVATWRDEKFIRILDLALSPDGRWLALSAAPGHGISILDARDGNSVAHLPDTAGRADWGMAFSPDGTRLAARSPRGAIALWETGDWREVRRVQGPPGRRHALALTDDTLFVGLDTGTVATFALADLARGEELRGHTGQVFGLTLDSAGTRLCTAAGDRRAMVRDLAHKRVALTLTGHTDALLRAAFTPDGSRIATAGHDRAVRIWDAGSGTLIVTLTGHRDFVSDLVFSSDGRRLISASGDWTARIWDDVPLAERLAAREAYRAFAATHGARIAALPRTAPLGELPGWSGFTERERQIARQLRVRARSR